MTTWFTSDWHFFHNKDFVYKPRGFENISDMNDAIIERHNQNVSSDDIVYVLGDLCLGGKDEEILQTNKKIIQSLKGHLRIIVGNHDTDRRIEMYEECSNTEILGYADRVRLNGYHFYLSHYPTITSNLDYDKPLKSRTINLFGHTHQKEKFYLDNPMMYNVGVDAHNCYPVSLEQVKEDIQEKFLNVPMEKEQEFNIKPYISFLDSLKNFDLN